MDIKCDCGKLIARVKDGKIYVWCKHCKKEVEIDTGGRFDGDSKNGPSITCLPDGTAPFINEKIVPRKPKPYNVKHVLVDGKPALLLYDKN